MAGNGRLRNGRNDKQKEVGRVVSLDFSKGEDIERQGRIVPLRKLRMHELGVQV